MKYLTSLFITALMISGFISFSQQKSNNDLSKYSKATFAAGCFWHEEALFESVKGVKEAVSGYAGGHTQDPSYESIESGNTGHAESVMVYYDPSVISYDKLLKVYFAGQDPTQVNGQGPDMGTQYRSIAFYNNDSEKKQIEDYIKQMNGSGKYKAPVAAQVMPLKKFWVAEDYHQDFIAHNPNQGYVQHVSIPEIKHFQKEYPEMVKPDHKF
ncbi:MAG TPA: peptide-methionine (S)-S-oxide reductase MsrA [Chitinophagaceae bacterium]|nr:peptide-methionine (S)-S-oxide reductase MsrA [Chitinophagaceae bacterium]